MAITRLNHAVLFVRDADAAADFYRSAFGFEELSRPEGMRAAFCSRRLVATTTTSGFSRSARRHLDRREGRLGCTTSRGRSTRSRRWPRSRSASASSER